MAELMALWTAARTAKSWVEPRDELTAVSSAAPKVRRTAGKKAGKTVALRAEQTAAC